jgi:hypothetical protein
MPAQAAAVTLAEGAAEAINNYSAASLKEEAKE